MQTEYVPGYYYTTSGEKIEGFIRYDCLKNNVLFYKKNMSGLASTVNVKNCKGFVLLKDSFVVKQDAEIDWKSGIFKEKKSYFLEILDKVGDITFFRYTLCTNAGPVYDFFFQYDTSNVVRAIPNIKKIAQLCAGFDALASKILAGEWKYSDFPAIVKLLKYKQYYDSKQVICFTSCWDETTLEDDTAYYAEIDTLNGAIFHLNFFTKQGLLLSSGFFTSFSPQYRVGDYLYYFPNGTVRKKISYVRGKNNGEILYHPNGELFADYYFRMDTAIYMDVRNQEGQHILDIAGSGKVNFEDPILHRTLTMEFKKRKLNSVFYLNEKGEAIYLLAEKEVRFKENKISRDAIFSDINYPIGALVEGYHGIVLLRCIVDQEGITREVELIKGLNPECDSMLLTNFQDLKKEVYWKPAKYHGDDVIQEMIIPINFIVTSLAPKTRDFWIYWDMFSVMQQMNTIRLMNQISTPQFRGFPY